MRTKIYGLILVLFIMTGCSNYRELNNLAIIVGAGIDYDKEKQEYIVTYQAINPQGVPTTAISAPGGDMAVINYQGRGKTIVEASRNTSKKISRQNLYYHTSLIIIGEAAAKKGLNFILDVYERDPKVRTSLPVLISRNTSAKNILDIVPSGFTRITSKEFLDKLENTSTLLGENGNNSKVYQVIAALTSLGNEPAISGISIAGNIKQGWNKSNLETTKRTYTVINGIGVFRKGKLVHWLDGTKAKSVQMINNTLKQTNVNVTCKKGTDLSVVINRAKKDVKVNVKEEKVFIDVHIHANAYIGEAVCDEDLKKVTILKNIEKKVEHKIKKDLQKGIREVQKLKTDIFGFGDILHRSHLKEWRMVKDHWNESFSKAYVRIKVQVNIDSTGMRTKSYPHQ
ncbi:Ger(x)C family spore germination protein [Bacillus toyonensis]|uniref:Ger(x)C family spore germination protein n=1 Tax=Bacillus toyonensis TaxID=155322 RepID=UPI001C0C8704|nr:Ger(x)C family spore germination protein [Bacillus toyonensis]MBU4642343.1 Ger(x)C family spore germination protein [Bacillus toyonensis]